MPNLYYYDALKRGQKEFRACTARGEYPYLPALCEVAGEDQLCHTANLGKSAVEAEMGRGVAGGTEMALDNIPR